MLFHRATRQVICLSITLVGLSTALIGSPVAEAIEPESPNGRPKLQYRRWSGALNVPDPVAISVADNGDVYVTQTQRRKIQDLDIRANSQWIPDDVGFTNVDEKRAFYHRVLAIGGDQVEAAKHVEDHNADGQLDWRDLTVISEKIHRLVDSDGDGTADKINLFADDFKTEVTGIAAGVMHWDDSVWATIAPDVWKLTDTTGDGHADRREIAATGFGLHIAYAGHDMHGLTIGPDGKVYWSIGDKGIAVTTDDGRRFHYPNQGGVMRCNLDGSDFEVFAHGLRNVQEFAFDRYGNLFGVDNDADMPGERERFVWIVDQMDAGWRCNYQYRGDQYNPWTDENLWQVAGKDHAAYLIPPISNYVDGPAGFKFNPGAALSSAYKDFFFLTSAPNGFQYAFRTERSGDSFRMVDAHSIGSGDPIVGLAFGPDGGLYGADWGGGYPLTQTGSVIRIDVPEETLSPQDRENRRSVVHWLSQRWSEQSDDVLSELLSHVDQRVRLRAQFALASNQRTDTLLAVLSNDQSDQLARVHGVWGLGQIARSGAVAADVLVPFLKDDDPIIRSVTAKTLGEIDGADAGTFVPLLADLDLHVRIHAGLALGRRPTNTATEPLLKLAETLPRDQYYLRHAVVTALAACATPQQLTGHVDSPSDQARICAVLALRRQADRSVVAFLDDNSDWVATEAARAIHDDLSLPDAMDDLAAVLDQDRSRPPAMTLRAINANFRLGTEASSQRLLRFIADPSKPLPMRLAACEALGQWTDPPLLDRVDGRRRDLSKDRGLDRSGASELLTRLVRQSETPLRVAAVKASRQLKISLSSDALIALVRDTRSPERLRIEALDTLASAEGDITRDARDQLFVEFSAAATPPIAASAIRSLAAWNADKAIKVIRQQLSNDAVAVRQACVKSLAKLGTTETDAMLVRLGNQFADGSLHESVHLDVYQALQSRSDHSTAIRDSLSRIESTPRFVEITAAKFREFAMCREGGDPARGEVIFRTDLRVQCSRCHRIGKRGSDIGPELTRIAKQRDADHLLRAIVYPSADIEPKYNAQTLLLADGNVIQGVIKSEDDTTTVLINSEGKEVEIPTDEIDDIAKTKVSLMPDMTAVLSPAEVRDLVAFLRTLR
ncbi:HEAT repeat domain-containing protein [Stieleria maiorica]|nr:HEAT repeat domain-containing protein [Stieleria maiorica]